MDLFKNSKYIIIFIVLFLSTGCEQKEPDLYQLMKSQDGRVYRLNKQTGHIVILEGDKILPLEVQKKNNNVFSGQSSPNDQAEEQRVSLVLQDEEKTQPIINPDDRYHDWGEEQLSGKNLKVSFKSYWETGVLHYILEAYPYSSLKKMLDKKEDDVYYQRKWHGFLVKLTDDNQDTVKIVPVNLWYMARTLDEKGKFYSVKARSEIQLLEDEFIRVTGFEVDWKLDRILIPDYKFENKVEDLIDTYSWYGEVDPKADKKAPEGAKYWWITFPDRQKIYFSTEEELLDSYKNTIEKILENHN
jgi:hypothetical protein